MDARQRLLTALDHQEADRVPFAFGGPNTGIHVDAYRKLLRFWGVSDVPVEAEDLVTQRARIHEDILQRMDVAVRKVDAEPFATARTETALEEDAGYRYFVDDWGIEWAMPLRSGLYYDARRRPLQRAISSADVDKLSMPALPTEHEMDLLRRKAQAHRDAGFAVLVDGLGGGLFEHAWWIRGFNEFMVDMMARRKLAERLLDKILDYRLRYWELILSRIGDLVDVAAESDDVAGQDRLILSPDLYRTLLKPRHRTIFQCIRENVPGKVFIHLHSCGAVRDLIPDLIDLGVDALNPVQVSAKGMDTAALKRDFGRDISFWGGGVDTQRVLPTGTPRQVRDEVRRRIDDLAPGGGFVFATVHNIQADVPPENIDAMCKALQEHGVYTGSSA